MTEPHPPYRVRTGALATTVLLLALPSLAGGGAATVLLLPPPSPARAELPTLHAGDRGPSVVRLQRALHVHADGIFGDGTVRAVRRFQRGHHLRADGVVGA